FHSEYIPIEKTIGTIHASMKIFATMVWLSEFLQDLSNIRTRGTISFDEYVIEYGEPAARKAASYCGQIIYGGRSAYKLGKYMTLKPKEEFFSSNCEYELLRSARGHFDPYGNIITGVCTGISVGKCDNLYDTYTSFDIENYPVIKTLVQKGVKGLYEYAVEKYGFIAKDGYAGKCHLCMDIRKHLVSCEAPYSELTPTEFYSRI
ncbi:MAG: radical SAM protein, partial [Armatimonadota bacterium]